MCESIDKYLFNKLIDNCDPLETKLIESLIERNYIKFFKHDLVGKILNSINVDFNDWDLSVIETKFDIKKEIIERILIYSAISSSQLYVCDNFLSFIHNQGFDDLKQNLDQLSIRNNFDVGIDGVKLYEIVRSVSLLKWSRIVFTSTIFSGNDSFLWNLWRMRSAIVHQISLTEPSSTLFNEIVSYSSKIQEVIKTDQLLSSQLKIELENEIMSAFLWFGDIERVRTSLESAQNLSDLKITLSGALGLRTQFQEKAVSQLVVRIDRKGTTDCQISQTSETQSAENHSDLPKDLALNDDTLLQKIKFVSSFDENRVELSNVEQTLMLSLVKFGHRIGSSSDELLTEEILSYIEFLIENSKVWSILYHCLLIRSLLEKDRRRRVERSMTQINELVDIVRKSEADISKTVNRFDYFYSVLPNPFWITEKHLANVLVSLGVTKSALDIYLRLNLWDDIIECYQRLGRRDKAEAIIRDKLKVEETPYLYCLLGDTTDDIEYYVKSWTLSGNKYPRAQKSLGNHYFKLKEYSQCIPYFKKSLELNPMQTDALFRLGFAAIITEDYELSASAYRRGLQFDTNSFEAWNNLSKAYIKLGQKTRSWHTLQEALKCNYDEWKIWENYIAVCADVGAFAEVIQSWHRLIDIKGKYTDDLIAEILVNSICNETLDCNQESAAKLGPKAQELFGRIAASSSGSHKIWRLYAKLLRNNKVNDIEKVLQCLQKCHRCAVQSNGWEKNPDMIIEVLNHCLLLSDEYYECSQLDESKAIQILSSCKMALNSTLVQLEKNKYIWSESDRNEEITKLVNDCQNKLKFIVTKLNTS